MRKDLWLFLTKLAVVTVVLGLAWFWWFKLQYPRLLQPIGNVVLPWLGAHKWQLSWTLEHMSNMVSYLALVLATPEIGRRWREVLRALYIGLPIMVLVHLLMLAAFDHIISRWGLSEITYRWAVPIWVVNDALPLILWLLLLPEVLTELFPRLRSGGLSRQVGKNTRE
ncbi:MAG: hypothetical protein ABIE70_07320 [bacterium]